jgi:hypothetical protein
MAAIESFQVSSLSELRRKRVLNVTCAGQSLVILFNQGRPCAVERTESSYEQARNSCPETYFTLPSAAPYAPRYSLEVRGEELWVTIERPRYQRLLAGLRRAIANFIPTLAGTVRKIEILRARSTRRLRVLQESSRRLSSELFEGE